MKINKLLLQDFKFFLGKNELVFEGKNVLIYGENGSGKSSIYWALYTFLQSSIKEDIEIKKYFDLADSQNLINRYAEHPDPKIELELIDNENRPKIYTISKDMINTNKDDDTQIKEANLASDFINYRLLSRIYDFRNSEDIDLFKIFEQEILDYISLSTILNAGKEWQELKKGLNPRPKMTHQSYKDFQNRISRFNSELKDYLTEIIEDANNFLRDDFGVPIKLTWSYENATYNALILGGERKRNHKTLPSKINLKAEFLGDNIRDKDIPKPHTFLNEAKLTAIALSIRLSVLKKRLSGNVLKVLILDDLLLSLDMSQRVIVSKIILEQFNDFQIIFLTHDRGYYQLLRRMVLNIDWRIFELYDNGNQPIINEGIDSLEKARRLYENHDYEAASNYLRKEAEEILKYFLDPELKYINKKFISLEDLIKSARKKFEQEQNKQLNRILKKKNMTPELASKLSTDFEIDTSLSAQEKGLLRGLKKDLFDFTEKVYRDKEFMDSIFVKLKDIKDRILNPSSHYSEAPIFRKEIEDALKSVKHLREAVKSKVSYRMATRRGNRQ